MKFRTRFSSYDPMQYTFSQPGEETMTRESEHDSTDINLIMERFNRSGKLPAMQTRPASYGDAIAIPYDQALSIVKNAQEAFSTLPATVRREFLNDPAEMEKFLMDEKNNQRAVELGLKEVKQPSESDLLKEVVKNTKPADKAEPKLA